MKISCYNLCRVVPGLALMAAVLATTPVKADSSMKNPGQLSSSDYKFAKEAACGGMMEVSLGNIGAANSSNPSIQQFGQRMVKDHTKAGQDLQQVLSSKGATVPMEIPSSKQKDLDRISKKTGMDFDKAFVSMMVKMHKDDVKKFTWASTHAKDPDLRAFAANTLPVIQEHLRMIEDMQSNMKHSM